MMFTFRHYLEDFVLMKNIYNNPVSFLEYFWLFSLMAKIFFFLVTFVEPDVPSNSLYLGLVFD